MVISAFPHAVWASGLIRAVARSDVAAPGGFDASARGDGLLVFAPEWRHRLAPGGNEKNPLRRSAHTRSIRQGLRPGRDPRRAIQVEFENTRNHNDELRLVAIFKKGEPECCCTVNK
jgi:hypothetical protein